MRKIIGLMERVVEFKYWGFDEIGLLYQNLCKFLLLIWLPFILVVTGVIMLILWVIQGLTSIEFWK